MKMYIDSSTGERREHVWQDIDEFRQALEDFEDGTYKKFEEVILSRAANPQYPLENIGHHPFYERINLAIIWHKTEDRTLWHRLWSYLNEEHVYTT